MTRSYTKFNSTRSKAEFARNALAGVVIAQLATATAPTGLASPPLTGWAGAPTDITLSVATAAYKGDSSDWASTSSGGLLLEPGEYSFDLRATITVTSAADGVFHWALTDAAFAPLYESSFGEAMTVTVQNGVGTLTGFAQITLAEQTLVELHVALEGSATGTITRGESSQLLVRKVG